MPSFSVSLAQLHHAVAQLCEKLRLGPVGEASFGDDRPCATAPLETDSDVARRLGLPFENNLDRVVYAYWADVVRANDEPEPDVGLSVIGCLGLGNMGRPLATRLRGAGYTRVLLNRTKAVAKQLAVGTSDVVVETVLELVEKSQVIVACLADESATDCMLLGVSGVIAQLKPGQLLIDLTNVSPATSMRCHIACQARGALFIDAPLAGCPTRAALGTTPILVGGSAEAFEAARPVLFAMSSHVHHIGEPGTGTAANLTTHMLGNAHSLATCEALWFARKLGLPDEQKWLLAAASSCDAFQTLRGTVDELSDAEDGCAEGAGFLHDAGKPVSQACEAMHFVMGAAEGLDLVMPTAELVRGCLDLAMDRGLERAGVSVLYHMLSDGSLPVPELIAPVVKKGPKLVAFPKPNAQKGLVMGSPHRWQR
eukprot:TRINITY_DN7808_c0_g1_i2.p1 TRINITY_DN7808_c0_g1~~TRINITY_DN7808_c0_g1_i2.p1  ORF type:complete len:425 (+),score=98.89 TRINITY_DN7808_c0_g1_i2:647-1921(+)